MTKLVWRNLTRNPMRTLLTASGPLPLSGQMPTFRCSIQTFWITELERLPRKAVSGEASSRSTVSPNTAKS